MTLERKISEKCYCTDSKANNIALWLTRLNCQPEYNIYYKTLSNPSCLEDSAAFHKDKQVTEALGSHYSLRACSSEVGGPRAVPSISQYLGIASLECQMWPESVTFWSKRAHLDFKTNQVTPRLIPSPVAFWVVSPSASCVGNVKETNPGWWFA